MKYSRQFASLLASGALALAVPGLAQQSGSGSSSPSSGSPGTSRQTDRQSPSQTAPIPSSNSDRNSTTPRSYNPSSSPTSTTSGTTDSRTTGSSNANANADLNANAGFYGPGASQFKNFDTDADGRISRAEFTSSAAASLNQSSTDTSATGSDKSARTEKKHWWSRSDKASDDMDPSETFTKLDTDNDGFLSQSELANANSKLKK